MDTWGYRLSVPYNKYLWWCGGGSNQTWPLSQNIFCRIVVINNPVRQSTIVKHGILLDSFQKVMVCGIFNNCKDNATFRREWLGINPLFVRFWRGMGCGVQDLEGSNFIPCQPRDNRIADFGRGRWILSVSAMKLCLVDVKWRYYSWPNSWETWLLKVFVDDHIPVTKVRYGAIFVVDFAYKEQ